MVLLGGSNKLDLNKKHFIYLKTNVGILILVIYISIFIIFSMLFNFLFFDLKYLPLSMISSLIIAILFYVGTSFFMSDKFFDTLSESIKINNFIIITLKDGGYRSVKRVTQVNTIELNIHNHKKFKLEVFAKLPFPLDVRSSDYLVFIQLLNSNRILAFDKFWLEIIADKLTKSQLDMINNSKNKSFYGLNAKLRKA